MSSNVTPIWLAGTTVGRISFSNSLSGVTCDLRKIVNNNDN